MGEASLENCVKGPIVIFGDGLDFSTGFGYASVNRTFRKAGARDELISCGYNHVDFAYNQEGTTGIGNTNLWVNNWPEKQMQNARKSLPVPLTEEKLRKSLEGFGGTCIVGFMGKGSIAYDEQSQVLFGFQGQKFFSNRDLRPLVANNTGIFEIPKREAYNVMGMPTSDAPQRYGAGDVLAVLRYDWVPLWIAPPIHKG